MVDPPGHHAIHCRHRANYPSPGGRRGRRDAGPDSAGPAGADLGRRPTIAELATETGLGVSKVGEALAVAGPPVSIFEPIGDDGEGVLGDVLEDPAAEAALEKLMVATLPVQVIMVLSVFGRARASGRVPPLRADR